MKPITFAIAFTAILSGGVALSNRPPRPSPPVDQRIRAFVTNYGGDGVSVIDPYAARLISQVSTGRKPHGAAIAPDGSAVYISNEGDGTVSVIDPNTNEVTASIQVGGSPNQLEVSPDGLHLFVTLHDQDALAAVDIAARRVVRVLPVGRAPHIALRSPDGKTIYITSEGDMKIVAVDALSWDVKSEISLMAFPRVLAVAPGGGRLYQTIRWLNGVLVLDPGEKKVVDRIALGEPVFATDGKDAHGVAVTPDGHELWLTTQTTDSVTAFDTADHRVLARIQVGRDPNWVAFTPDGRLAVISNTGSADVSVVDVARHEAVATVKVGPSPKRLAVGLVDIGSVARGGRRVITFDDVPAGGLPAGWKVEATNPSGGLATWQVVEDGTAPSPANVLSLRRIQNSSRGVFNLCWNPSMRLRDGRIEVKLRARGGRVDQGGGLIWRIRDHSNYYVARWNPLENNLRLYYVKEDRRVQIASADVSLTVEEWHTLVIDHRGNRIRCFLDGEQLLHAVDETFPEEGGVGVWTKADAATSFDDLIVDALGR